MRFVLNGLPKGGSTWLQRLLDGHPRIRCLKEHKLAHLAKRIQHAITDYASERHSYLEMMRQSDEDETLASDLHLDLAVAVAHQMLDEAATQSVEAVGFKDNLINPLFLLDRTDLKLLLMVRDPRDVVVSTWRWSIGNSDYLVDKFGTIEAFSEHYAGYWTTRMRERLKAIEVAPDRCRMISYEALQQDTAAEMTGICEFLAVAVDAGEIQTAVQTASFKAVTGAAPGEEDISRHARKGVVGDWRNHLSVEVAEALRVQCTADSRFEPFFHDAADGAIGASLSRDNIVTSYD